MNTPIDKQAALFLSRKRRVETMQEALDGGINHLMQGRLNDALVEVFANNAYGPEPIVTFKMSIRRDAASPDKYVYSARTSVTHDIGQPISLFGLKA